VASSTAVVRGRRYEPPLRALGQRHLKGFDDSFEVLEVVRRQTSPERPEPDGVTLVGRDATIAAVRTGLFDAGARLVLVRGEPGVGKTELVHAVAVGLVDTRFVWVGFDASIADGFDRWCRALDAHVALLPVGVLAMLGRERVERLATFLPSIASRLPVTPTAVVGDGDRELAFEALTAVSRALGNDVLVVLDDVQWAGATALAYLRWLLRHTSELRLLATSRPPIPEELVESGALVVDLDLLAADDLRVMLRRRGVARDVAESAIARAGGNPFLAIVATAAGGQQRARDLALDPVAERFLSLDADVMDVLTTAALLGRAIDSPLLEGLVAVGPDEIHRSLDVGLRSGLLTSEGTTLRFTHDLVRDAAAARCPLPKRAAVHAAAARAYQRRGNTPMEATHLLAGFAALDPVEGARRMRTVLEELDALGAFEEAYAMATRFAAIVADDHRCGARERASALIAALAAAHRYPALGTENLRLAALAADAALAANDATLIAEAALLRGQSGSFGQSGHDFLALINEALRRVEFSDQGLSARLTAMRAYHLMTFEGEGARALQEARGAAELARGSGDYQSLAEVLVSYAYVLLASSDLQLQTAVIGEALELVPRLSASMVAYVRTHAARCRAVTSLQVGDRNGFEAARTELRDWSHRWNRVVLKNLETMWAGMTANLDGSPAEAELHVESLLDPRHSDDNFARSAGMIVAVSHRWRGTPHTVSPLLLDLADQQPTHTLVQSLAATMLALDGRMADAHHCLDRVLGRA
jgi:hypothetical protein